MAKKTTTYECGPSDHVTSVARAHDFFNWETLWKQNGSLKRDNPNILLEGDIISAEPKEEKWFQCNVDAEYTWKVPTYKLFLNVKVLKADFSPIKNVPYELDFETGGMGLKVETDAEGTTKRYNIDGLLLPLSGKTDGDGAVKVQIPPQLATATLTVRVASSDTEPPPAEGKKKPAGGGVAGDPPIRWTLHIGRLSPIQENLDDDECITGVQQRLVNIALGGCGVTGKFTKRTKETLAEFQRLYEVDEDAASGTIPADTRKKLVEVHDAAGAPPKPTAS